MISWIISFVFILLSLDTKDQPPDVVPYTISYGNINYAYRFLKDIDPHKLSLVANYAEKRTSFELMIAGKCSAGINGGFYGTDGKAQGLVKIDKKILNKSKQSITLNGFIYIDNILHISKEFSDSAKIALQTGPLLISNGKVTKFNMERDKPARRMIFAKDLSGRVIFIAVFDPETEKIGPYLKDLPEILQLINLKEDLNLTDAVNLDGGGASAFHSPEKVLSETFPVGSWWCVLSF